MIKKQKDAGKIFPRGYMATGMEDTHYQENVAFMDKYEAMGVEFERIIDHGAHNWEYCNKHVRQFLEWLNIGGAVTAHGKPGYIIFLRIFRQRKQMPYYFRSFYG